MTPDWRSIDTLPLVQLVKARCVTVDGQERVREVAFFVPGNLIVLGPDGFETVTGWAPIPRLKNY